MATRPAEIEAATQAALDEFAAGLDGKLPEPQVVEMAARIVKAALSKTKKADISVDDADGALSFDLELPNGYLMMAELYIDGNIDASVYDTQKKLAQRMPSATETDIIGWFQP